MADPTNSRPTSPVTSAVSDENLRSWLTDALESAHQDAEYVWVESIDVDEGAVVYSTRTEDEPSTLLRRTFTFDEDTETVSLSDDPSPVRRKVTYEDAPDAPVSATSQIPKALQRVLAAFGFRVSQDGEEGEGTSDVDLRELMDRALRSTEPGYYETVEIFPDTKTVIYVSIPEDDLLWWRRTYELMDDGGLSLNDDREQIEPVMRYEPVNASSQEKEEPASAVVKSESTNDSEPDNTNVTELSTDAKNDCGCETQGDGDVTRKGTTMKDKTKVVDGLIANEASPFTEDHSEFLNSLSEDGLQDLSDRYEVADAGDAAEGADVEEEVKETKAASDTSSDGSPKADPPKADDGTSSPSSTPSDPPSDDDEVRLSRDEYQELSAAAKELKAQKAAEKAELVSVLDAAIDDGFEKSDLEAMDIATLRKMAKAHKLDEPSHDYSGRGLASAAVANSEVAPIPKPWTNALKSRDTNREEAN